MEAEKEDGLDNCAPAVRYAIRRLIRGISSSREFARQGFALGLAAVLQSIKAVSVEAVMKLIPTLLEYSASMKGPEAKDNLLGRLFGFGSLARSGRVLGQWKRDKSSPILRDFVTEVVQLGNKKRYLTEPAVALILDLTRKLPDEAIFSEVLDTPCVQDWFNRAANVGDPDALFLALKFQERTNVQREIFGKLLPYPFSLDNFFTEEHLLSLAACFKESAFCLPRIHSIWHVITDMLIREEASQSDNNTSSSKKHKKSKKGSSSEDSKKNLRNFCEVIIERSLLLSSHDRKHLAFNIIIDLLPRLSPSSIQVILSSKVVLGLMDILSNASSWLYNAGQHFLKELVSLVSNDNDRCVAVIINLQKYSFGRFDSLTKTKTVKGLIAKIQNGQDCLHLVQNLMALFVDEGSVADEPSDQSQTTDENSEVGSIEDKELVGEGNADLLKSWVVNTIPFVLKNLKLTSKGSSLTDSEMIKCIEEKFQVQTEILKFFAVQVSLFRTLSSNDDNAFKKTLATESALFQELLLQVLLHPEEFWEAAIDVIICCKKTFPSIAQCDNSSALESVEGGTEESDEDGSEEPNEDGSLESIDVLVQTFLSVLPHVSGPVFRVFSDEITETGLLDMLRVVKIDLKGSRRQTDSDDDEDEARVDIEDDDGMEDADVGNVDDATDEMEDDSADEVDEDQDDLEETVDNKATDGDDAEATKGGEDSDDSDGMDDDAMFRIDPYIARIFKERNNLPGSETQQSQLMRFKLRVLTLLEIYLQRNPGKKLVLEVYAFLMQAFVKSHSADGNEQFRQRIGGILQKRIFKAKECPKGFDVELSRLESLLQKALHLASRSRYKPVASAAQNATFWILKIINSKGCSKQELASVVDKFQYMLNDYFSNKKSRLKIGFVKEAVRRNPWVGRELFGFALQKIGSTKAEYRRVQTLELVDSILKSWVGDDVSSASKVLKKHMALLCELMQEILTKMPENKSRRQEVRRFCTRALQTVTRLNLKEKFQKKLSSEAYTLCEAQLGAAFVPFRQ
ncbi:DNA polymerase V [Triticum urartu]|uniref:DNA polymerase V n=1 Tax=Triticum urartu TaxID=4572 RepID=M7ZPZ8_TRIUA|nr:DNA polymerase V [Triticum urartu]